MNTENVNLEECMLWYICSLSLWHCIISRFESASQSACFARDNHVVQGELDVKNKKLQVLGNSGANPVPSEVFLLVLELVSSSMCSMQQPL